MVVVAARRRGRAERRTRRKEEEEEEGSGEGASEAGRLRRRAAARAAREVSPPSPSSSSPSTRATKTQFSAPLFKRNCQRASLSLTPHAARPKHAQQPSRKKEAKTKQRNALPPPSKTKKKAKWPRRPAASCPSSRWRSPSCWAHPPCLHRPARPCAGAGVGGA